MAWSGNWGLGPGLTFPAMAQRGQVLKGEQRDVFSFPPNTCFSNEQALKLKIIVITLTEGLEPDALAAPLNHSSLIECLCDLGQVSQGFCALVSHWAAGGIDGAPH